MAKYLILACLLHIATADEAKELTTVQEVEDFINDDKASVIGFYAAEAKAEGETDDGMIPDPEAKKPDSWDDEDDGDWEAPMIKKVTSADAFKEFAGKQYGTRFAYSSSDEVLAKYKLSNAIVVYKPPNQVSKKYGDKPRARYGSKKINDDALKQFIKKNSIPLVGLYSSGTSDSYTSSDLPVLKLYMEPDLTNNPKGTNYFMNRLRKVAAKFKGKIMFAVVRRSDYSWEIANYGVDESTLNRWDDVFVGLDDGSNKYKMDGTFSSDNVQKFCEDFGAGKLTKAERFEKPPASEDKKEDEASGGEEKKEL